MAGLAWGAEGHSAGPGSLTFIQQAQASPDSPGPGLPVFDRCNCANTDGLPVLTAAIVQTQTGFLFVAVATVKTR